MRGLLIHYSDARAEPGRHIGYFPRRTSYRAWMAKKAAGPDEPTWPGVKAAAWSKWISPYLRSRFRITDASKALHSFRHTFKRMARDAGFYEELHDAITGHANKGSVGRDYGVGYSIKPLAKAIA